VPKNRPNPIRLIRRLGHMRVVIAALFLIFKTRNTPKVYRRAHWWTASTNNIVSDCSGFVASQRRCRYSVRLSGDIGYLDICGW
jgi:hypothetical protein